MNNNLLVMNNPTLLKNLRNIPDFPVPGIQFKDVTTLFKSAKCMKIMLNELYEIYKDKGITKVVGIESRGFVLGAALAVKLGAGFVMCRKPGKLPAETLQESYMKEYGKDLAQCTLYIIPADMSDEDAVAHIHKTVDDLAMTGRFACRLRDEKPDRAVNLADELYRYSRLKYMELAEK